MPGWYAVRCAGDSRSCCGSFSNVTSSIGKRSGSRNQLQHRQEQSSREQNRRLSTASLLHAPASRSRPVVAATAQHQQPYNRDENRKWGPGYQGQVYQSQGQGDPPPLPLPRAGGRYAEERKVPARDRQVTFGGWYRDAVKDRLPPPLLGSLRPKQLQWMARELWGTDLEEWAELAEEVLKDPVYKDRIEWTEYEKRLEKQGAEAAMKYAMDQGWVNRLDPGAWDGVEPDRIGTSFSKPIPRVGQWDPNRDHKQALLAALRTGSVSRAGTRGPFGRTAGSRQSAARKRRGSLLAPVMTPEQLERRRERRERQAERRHNEQEGATGELGDREASRGGSEEVARESGSGGEGLDSGSWMPRTNSRDWLIDLVQKQEAALNEKGKETPENVEAEKKAVVGSEGSGSEEGARQRRRRRQAKDQ